jgi:DNA-binding NarL/FixJ family response regulator
MSPALEKPVNGRMGRIGVSVKAVLLDEHVKRPPRATENFRRGPGVGTVPGGKSMEEAALETKILVIDDQAMVREGLRNMFLLQHGTKVIGEGSNLDMAVRFAADLLPDIVILGVSGTDKNTIASIREIVVSLRGTRVVVILRSIKKEFLDEVLRSGASAFLAKDSPFEELLRAVQTVIGGQTYITPMIAGVVIDGYVCSRPVKARTTASRSAKSRC